MFGNFGYAAYNTLYRLEQGFSQGELSQATMSLSGKLSFFAKNVLFTPGTGLVFLAFLFFFAWNTAQRKSKPHFWLEFILSALLLPFLLIGCLRQPQSGFNIFMHSFHSYCWRYCMGLPHFMNKIPGRSGSQSA